MKMNHITKVKDLDHYWCQISGTKRKRKSRKSLYQCKESCESYKK